MGDVPYSVSNAEEEDGSEDVQKARHVSGGGEGGTKHSDIETETEKRRTMSQSTSQTGRQTHGG